MIGLFRPIKANLIFALAKAINHHFSAILKLNFGLFLQKTKTKNNQKMEAETRVKVQNAEAKRLYRETLKRKLDERSRAQ